MYKNCNDRYKSKENGNNCYSLIKGDNIVHSTR